MMGDSTESQKQSLQAVGIGKRIVAIIYDLLIVFFFSILVTLVAQQLIIQLELVTLEQVQISKGGEKVSVIPSDSLATPLLKSLWFVISMFYFGHYWTKRGQTPGMKVWKIKAVTQNDGAITWIQAIKRYLFALFGLGLIWILFNKNHLSLQDIMSKTTLIKIAE